MAASSHQSHQSLDVLDTDETASSAGEHSDAISVVAKRKRQADIDVWADEPDDMAEFQKKQVKRAKTTKTTRSKAKGKAKSNAKRNAVYQNNRRRNPQDFRDKADENGSEDDLLDPRQALVPEHIHNRRQHFEGEKEALGQAGLKLPPIYDDVYFSDDERDPKDLEERPRFDPEDHVEPCRPYLDVPLEGSAGLIPASIAQYLREYQIDGVRFLHEKFVYQQGAILGDDMGLGKTVQVAAFLTAAFGKTGDERDAKRLRKMRRQHSDRWYPRVLIVCPSTLMANWEGELNRWGWWKVEIYHGAGKDDTLKAARNGAIEIMLTTYTTYSNCQDRINSVEWDVVIADECHLIKDGTRAITRAMNQVNSLCRIGLTGTAIQNKYEEFWTLLNWTNPGSFGSLMEWKHSIVTPLTRGQSHNATLHQLSLARKTAKKLVHNLLPEFFLRRMKTLIAHQLPKKTDRVVFCPLTELQKDAYKRLLESEEVRAILTSVDDCECGSPGRKQGWCCGKTLPDGRTWISLVFPSMFALKLLSNHLSLLLPSEKEANPRKREQALGRLKQAVPKYWERLYKGRNNVELLSNPGFCGKWKVLKELLSHWYNNNDKVLVFSHSVRLLRYLESLFQTTSYTVSFLSGEMPVEERQQEVDDFNSDSNKFVFLISTKAGGVGLNITSANKVVIFDPHWNPSWDLQAQDRAYRIGQRRDVEVYRLVSAGTIEEIIYARQIYKQQQANIGYNASTERRYFKGVQQDSDRKGELFGLANIFSFHQDQVILQNIMNQTNIAEARVNAQIFEDVHGDKIEEDDDFKRFKQEDKDDDYGLSQFAAYVAENPEDLVKKNKATKLQADHAIQAILSSAGVRYTHDNQEVIGSSKVEEQLSRRAELVQDADWGDLEGQSALFAEEKATDAFIEGHDGAESGFTPDFKPPEDVKQRQFCSMAKSFGFDSVTEFALLVEQMTQQERRDALDSFYKRRVMELLEEELKKDKNADEKKVGILKAEAGVSEDLEFEAEDYKKDVKIEFDFKGQAFPSGRAESEHTASGVKSESRGGQPALKKEVNMAPELVPETRPISSLFVFDDGDDDDVF